MTFYNWQEWHVIAKLDPDKELSEEKLRRLIKSPVLDAIVVGGTQGITYKNTFNLMKMIRDTGYTGPLIQEVSSIESISLEPDMHFIPLVLNAGSLKWIRDAHLKGIHKGGSLIDWSRVLVEGYLILNPDSAVAHHTEASIVNDAKVLDYLHYAEKILGLKSFYIEYSGTFGDLALITALSRARERIHLTYGGGIRNSKQVEELLKYVDTVVIGNALYDDEKILKDIFKC